MDVEYLFQIEKQPKNFEVYVVTVENEISFEKNLIKKSLKIKTVRLSEI